MSLPSFYCCHWNIIWHLNGRWRLQTEDTDHKSSLSLGKQGSLSLAGAALVWVHGFNCTYRKHESRDTSPGPVWRGSLGEGEAGEWAPTTLALQWQLLFLGAGSAPCSRVASSHSLKFNPVAPPSWQKGVWAKPVHRVGLTVAVLGWRVLLGVISGPSALGLIHPLNQEAISSPAFWQ